MKRHLDIYFYQNTEDYNLEGDERFESKRFEAKICTQEDFGRDNSSVEYYSAWKDYYLICPDTPD